MIQIESGKHDSAFTASRVRQNFMSAAIAAAMMLWYGFGRLQFTGGSGAFGLGDAISIHTLRIGGIAMAISALASLTGFRWALLFDGVCSVLIGALFCLSAALMMSGGGTGFLYIIFGVMFIVAGVRNAREWAALSATTATKPPDPRTERPPDAMTTDSFAHKLQEQKRQPDPPTPKQPPKPAETEPPPEGFLSSFAPEREDTSDNA